MIEAIDKMMTEKLSEEISKFIEDRKALAQEKIAYKENVGAHSGKLQEFVLTKLSEELKELHGDRKGVHENFKKMEEFVVNALAKEIKEFHEDKKGVVETKVKLVAEARKQMAKMKEAFITKSAKIVESAVNKKLAEELSTLKEDISKARTINFGKKIFEAFASEYQNSYLNEKSETSKLMKVVDETTLKLAEAEKAVKDKEAVIESKNAESKRQADLMERNEKMADMLKPLGKEKSEVMAQLLESVQTNKLQTSFDKYLPHVMADKAVPGKTKVLSESGGNRTKREDADLTNIRKLAGI
jgi:hypothetical protein